MREAVIKLAQLIVGKDESVTVRNRVVAGAGGLIGLRVAFSGLSFLIPVILARRLGLAGFGAYSYSFAWIVLLGIPALLGLDRLLVRDVAAYQEKSQWGLVAGLLRRANWAVFAASLGLALPAAAVAWALRGTSQAWITFWIALALLPLITLTRVRQAAMQGLHRVVLGSVPEQLIQPALLLALLAVPYSRFGHELTAAGAMGLNVTATAAAFLIGAALLHRTIPDLVKKAAPVYRDAAWARSALPLILYSSMGVFFGQADTLILGALKGAAAVGAYTVAHKGADMLTFFFVAQNAAFASTAASLYASGDLVRLQRLVTRLARWTLLATTPIAVFLIGFGRWYLKLYGPQFVQAQTVLAILSLGQFISMGMGSVGNLLVVAGRERDAASAIAVGTAANVVLTFTLIPLWGVEGAAVAYTASIILWNVWMAVSLHRRVGLEGTALGKWT